MSVDRIRFEEIKQLTEDLKNVKTFSNGQARVIRELKKELEFVTYISKTCGEKRRNLKQKLEKIKKWYSLSDKELNVILEDKK